VGIFCCFACAHNLRQKEKGGLAFSPRNVFGTRGLLGSCNYTKAGMTKNLSVQIFDSSLLRGVVTPFVPNAVGRSRLRDSVRCLCFTFCQYFSFIRLRPLPHCVAVCGIIFASRSTCRLLKMRTHKKSPRKSARLMVQHSAVRNHCLTYSILPCGFCTSIV